MRQRVRVPSARGSPKAGTSNPSAFGTVPWQEVTLATTLGPPPRERIPILQ